MSLVWPITVAFISPEGGCGLYLGSVLTQKGLVTPGMAGSKAGHLCLLWETLPEHENHTKTLRANRGREEASEDVGFRFQSCLKRVLLELLILEGNTFCR